MSSPVRFGEEYSFLEGEKLSPIKIPIASVPKVNVHPHGLAAKHEARRNTIHHMTPKSRRIELNQGASGDHLHSSALKPLLAPLTSPRAISNRSNIESLRKSKTNIDAKLKDLRSSRENSPSIKSRSSSNKENLHSLGKPQRRSKSPFESSPEKVSESPLNRKRQQDAEDVTVYPQKIAKVVTNANNLESSFKQTSFTGEEVDDEDDDDIIIHHNTSIKVDEVFNKEDLVGQLSNAEKTAENGVDDSSVQVIDNDSDSDLTNNTSAFTKSSNYNSKLHDVTLVSRKNQDITQINHDINVEQEYITPQRFTEPVAKSPATSQQNRMLEEVEVENTSPLKVRRHQDEADEYYKSNAAETNEQESLAPNVVESIDDDDDDDEDDDIPTAEEPTINFLMSPNSKPVFSIDHIKKIQNENSKEIESLEGVIYQKNQEILRFSEELSATNGKFLILDQEIKELASAKKKLIANEELLKVQLKHTERELAKATKNFKLKSNSLVAAEAKIEKLKQQLHVNSNERTSLIEDVVNAKQKIESLSKELNDETNRTLDAQSQITRIEQALYEREKELTSLTDSNLESNAKVESLLKEKEDLLQECANLRQEKEELQDINSKQTSLLEELDKLENLAKVKISDLENSLEATKKELENLKNENSENLDKLSANGIIHQKEIELFEQKLKNNELERDHLRSKYDDSESRVNKLNSKIKEIERESVHLEQELKNANDQIDVLKSTNKEKDNIISGDTKKMSELVEKVNDLKQKISEKAKVEETGKDSLAVAELQSQIKSLKEELNQSNEKSQAKIQEVAESLYYQYSKKHELKVNEVRKSIEKKFKKQIDQYHFQNNAQSRDIESLQKKVDIVNSENHQLLALMEELKADSEQRKRSPRKGIRGRH